MSVVHGAREEETSCIKTAGARGNFSSTSDATRIRPHLCCRGCKLHEIWKLMHWFQWTDITRSVVDGMFW
jgi:hypothetical protein